MQRRLHSPVRISAYYLCQGPTRPTEVAEGDVSLIPASPAGAGVTGQCRHLPRLEAVIARLCFIALLKCSSELAHWKGGSITQEGMLALQQRCGL